MNAVNRQDGQNGKVRDEDGEIKSVGPVNAAEGVLVENQVQVSRQRVRVDG
jgi:hypothetical protein